MSNIHILSKYSNLCPSRHITLIDKNSLMVMLYQGSNIVYLPMNLISKKGCGFFPVSERVEHIQTQGLKWNMGNKDNYV